MAKLEHVAMPKVLKRKSKVSPDDNEQSTINLTQKLEILTQQIRNEDKKQGPVFTHQQLLLMATERPTSIDAFQHCEGVTERKLIDFGSRYLSVINETLGNLLPPRPSDATVRGCVPASVLKKNLAVFAAGNSVGSRASLPK